MSMFEKAHEQMIWFSSKWHVPNPTYEDYKKAEQQQSPENEWTRQERGVFQGDSNMGGESPDKPWIKLFKASDSPDIYTEEKSNATFY